MPAEEVLAAIRGRVVWVMQPIDERINLRNYWQEAAMSETRPFFADAPVRAIVDTQGNPWFVARDVCAILDIGNPRQALVRLEDRVGGGFTAPVLSHHRAYGSVPRRFT